mgnify:CR=1 FL=1
MPIGEQPRHLAAGICGSGIIEVVAEMYIAGIISEDGVVDGAMAAKSPRIIENGRTFSYVLNDGDPLITVTQNDVRAIQLAKAFGARVLATAGSEAKCTAMRELGADVAINYRDTDFVEAVREATGGKGADLILDMVGGDYITRNYQAAAVEGRIVQIAFLGGAKAEANFSLLMVKRLVHTGSTLRARPVEFKAGLVAELQEQVWALFAERKVQPVMDMIYPLSEAWRAHERMEAGSHIGKIVLDVG